MGGEMQHGINVVIAEYFREQCRIASISGDEFTACHGCFKACRQVVESQNLLARKAQLPHDVATDVAGSSSDQYLLVFAQVLSLVSGFSQKV
jgi:hypothetical protein